NPSAVNDGTNEINISFADATRVTYRTAPPIIFNGSDVNIDETLLALFQDKSEHAGQKSIYLGSGHGGFSDGQPLIYQVVDPVNAIGGLTNGNPYYVHLVGSFSIQLANTYCEARGGSGAGSDSNCTFDPTPSSDTTDDLTPIARHVISLTRPHPSDPTPNSD